MEEYINHIKNIINFVAKVKKKNITPLPKLILRHNDKENANDFLGKTAYYNPEDMSIVLYTFGRDPKALVNSFCHELIHHIQNLEGRLNNINTQNINESDHLEKIEREAYQEGGILFRSYKDHIRKNKNFMKKM
jgi:hypothetical protein